MLFPNKLGLKDEELLAREEERLAKLRSMELYDEGALEALGKGRYKDLADIHHYIFQDVYDFAGKLRSVELSMGLFYFAPLRYLTTAIENIDQMPALSFEDLVEKYVEMNIAHPFVEGTGRASRLWLDAMLLKHFGCFINWSKISKKKYFRAMEESPVDEADLKEVLRKAIEHDKMDRKSFMKALDASFAYEDLEYYKTKKLEGFED